MKREIALTSSDQWPMFAGRIRRTKDLDEEAKAVADWLYLYLTFCWGEDFQESK